jgi:hypothetical protein
MVEVLRSGEGMPATGKRVGLVSNLSGIFGKQAVALFSNLPNEKGYGFEDVTALAAEKELPLPLNGDYQGAATIVGYTVVFNKEHPSHGIAYCETPQGERTVVKTTDKSLLDMMTKEEFCGRVINVVGDGSFSLEI